MVTVSLEVRERILAACDGAEGTRAEIARRFGVSLGLVKKILAQRQRMGDIAPRHQMAGRKPVILDVHLNQLKALLEKNHNLTLKELRAATGLDCSLQAIYLALAKIGLRRKQPH